MSEMKSPCDFPFKNLSDIGLTQEEATDLIKAMGPVERVKGEEAGKRLRKILRELAHPTEAAKEELVEIAIDVPEFRRECGRQRHSTLSQMNDLINNAVRRIVIEKQWSFLPDTSSSPSIGGSRR